MDLSIVKNATCTYCGCLCDDIELHADGERIVKARNACSLGRSWFFNHGAERRLPDAVIDGRPATLAAAIEAAADILHEAHLPLIYGLGTVTCEAQREAVRLAELVGGGIDSQTSVSHGPTKIAGQLMGKVSCTLGEVKNRADLIVYWGSNPAESHPRHFTKYSLTPKGKFVPTGRRGRTMILVDVRETPSEKAADLFLRIRPGKDFEVLTALRALLKGQSVDQDGLSATGLGMDQFDDLLARLKRARFGIFFFGSGLTMTRGKHMNVAALLALTRELNAFTKFSAMPMRTHGNEAGADNVCSWTTGYPFGVNFSRGYPRYNPGEFTAVDLLVRQEADAALIVGADPAASLPPSAVEHLARIPSIVLDPRMTHTARLARVHIATAVTGISAAGTAYRMDKVPLPLRTALQSPYPTDEEVLRRIRQAVAAKPAVPASEAGPRPPSLSSPKL